MKYAILLLLIFTAACTTSDKAPEEKDFAVLVSTAEGTLRTNEEVELTTELVNRSKKNVNIMHAAPLIQVQIYNEKNEPMNKILVRDDIGLNHQLAADESYNPDSKIYPRGVRTITIDQPGRYKLIGTASFSVELGEGERRDYKISSEPVEILVEEGQQTVAATEDGRFQLKVDPGSEQNGYYSQVYLVNDSGETRVFQWDINKDLSIAVPTLISSDLDQDGLDELIVIISNAAHVINTRDWTELPVQSAGGYLNQRLKSQIMQLDGYVWVQLNDQGQLYEKAIDAKRLAAWGDQIDVSSFVQYKVVDRRLMATVDAVVGAGEEKLAFGHMDLFYGYHEQGIRVEQANGFQLEPKIAGEIPLFAIQAGEEYLALNVWDNEVDLHALLGKPLKESTKQLGPEADTFDGTYTKSISYQGLELNLASGDGERFWLIGMQVTERYPTSLGIRVGDTVQQVEAAYPSIKVAKDGRNPPRNFAYLLGEWSPISLLIDIKDGRVNKLNFEYLMD